MDGGIQTVRQTRETAISTDAIGLLKDDHKTVEKLFK